MSDLYVVQYRTIGKYSRTGAVCLSSLHRHWHLATAVSIRKGFSKADAVHNDRSAVHSGHILKTA